MFTFKQFKIHDEHCGMKVGTDGVLLGAWTSVDGCQKVLDVGCGSGLLSLMLAQRAPNADVTGVEIDDAAAADARLNVEHSPFALRVRIVCRDAVLFSRDTNEKYDCIVSNPPYHEEELLPPDASRARARHTEGGLSFTALLEVVTKLLSDKAEARFCVILPAVAVTRFESLATAYGLFTSARLNVFTTLRKPCRRVLLDLRREFRATPKIDELVLCSTDGGRSKEYSELCKDFYL